MSLFTTNYENVNNNNQEFDVLPEGNYELVIKHAYEDTTRNGKEYLQLDLAVRNDLDNVDKLKDTNARFHNRVVFHQLWARRDGSGYPLDQLQTILYAVGVPEGKTIEDVQDLDRMIAGKPVLAHVYVEESEYNGETRKRNRIKPWEFFPSEFQNVQHQWKNNNTNSNEDPFKDLSDGNVKDDDLGNSLPF